MKLIRTENQLTPNKYWTLAVENYVFHPKAVALFDQNVEWPQTKTKEWPQVQTL